MKIFIFLLSVVKNVVSHSLICFFAAVMFDLFQRRISYTKLKLFSEFTFQKGGVISHIEILDGTDIG